MIRYLADTDVVIDFLKGVQTACQFMEDNLDDIGLSVITVTEVYAGIRGEEERQTVERLFFTIPLFDITQTIAQRAGDWISQYGKAYAVELPDALIAATAAEHRLDLKTLNTKHFPMFKGLKPAYRKK